MDHPNCGHKVRFKQASDATLRRTKNFHVDNDLGSEEMFSQLAEDAQHLIVDLTTTITHIIWEECRLKNKPKSKDSLVSDLINITNQFKLEALAANGDPDMMQMVTPQITIDPEAN